MIFAVVAIAAALHLAPAQPQTQASFVHFATPSGNINCLGGAAAPTFVECIVKKASWPKAITPKKPKTCDLDFVPTEIDLSNRKVSVGACRGDVGPLCGPGSQRCSTLAYGRSVDIGAVRCTSATIGVTCRYRSRPRVGFFIARDQYVLYRPVQ